MGCRVESESLRRTESLGAIERHTKAGESLVDAMERFAQHVAKRYGKALPRFLPEQRKRILQGLDARAQAASE